MAPYLTIDPGTKCIGYAIFDDRFYLEHCKAPRVFKESRKTKTTAEALGEFIPQLLCQIPQATNVLIELPFVYPKERTKDPNDLIHLATVAGACATKGMLVRFITPGKWKGQVPKELCHKRAIKELNTQELSRLQKALAECPKSLAHNMLDAVAMGVLFWRKDHARKEAIKKATNRGRPIS